MANFEMALSFLLRHEDPSLSGNVTHEPNGGICRFGVNSVANHEALEDGFYGMEREKALEYASILYRHRYFEPCGGFHITDQAVANLFFDLVVNQGINEATKIAQRACNRTSFSGGVHVLTVDGVPGMRTLDAINLAMPSELIGEIKNYAAEFYNDLARTHPAKFGPYLAGWLRRLSN